jgi:hypothetical protein
MDKIAGRIVRFIDRHYEEAKGRGNLDDPQSRAMLELLLEVTFGITSTSARRSGADTSDRTPES